MQVAKTDVEIPNYYVLKPFVICSNQPVHQHTDRVRMQWPL
jgi:hypothetical protein